MGLVSTEREEKERVKEEGGRREIEKEWEKKCIKPIEVMVNSHEEER